MLLMEQPTKKRKSRDFHRTRIVPSRVSGCRAEFLDEVPFGGLGVLREAAVMQPKPEHTTEILRWIAAQPSTDSVQSLIERCTKEHSELFQSWTGLEMFDRSLRLPKATVAVHVIREPVCLCDDPPRSVLSRWMDAIIRYPDADTFYIEPFFNQPLDADAKALTIPELQSAVADQWDAIFAKASRWGWLFHLESAINAWRQRRQKRAELKLQSEQYLAKLREREKATLAAVPVETPDFRDATVSYDERMRARREERQPGAVRRALRSAEDESWLNDRLASIAPAIRRDENARLRALDIRSRLGNRSRVEPAEAIEVLSRRDFNFALMMGMVSLPRVRSYRYDPIAAIRLQGETFLRQVAHWDRWNVMINGKLELRTFIHV